mgnify:CR=1 FL=1|jgi:ribosome recycling factor
MSATAFQRRRRERVKALRAQAEKQKVNYSEKTKEELKALLTEREIEFDDRAKKDELIKLLEGAE